MYNNLAAIPAKLENSLLLESVQCIELPIETSFFFVQGFKIDICLFESTQDKLVHAFLSKYIFKITYSYSMQCGMPSKHVAAYYLQCPFIQSIEIACIIRLPCNL